MIIEQLAVADVVRLSRETLAMPSDGAEARDAAFLAALVRRTAGILCPCSPRTIARAIAESLEYLGDREELNECIDEAVEAATAAGDLLELTQVTTDDPGTQGTWVFAAPPSFVVRPNGSIFVVGIAAEEPSPLPSALTARIVYDRQFRVLRPLASENLPQTLRELGLLELSERNWLKLPKEETAEAFRSRLQKRLDAQPPSGEIPDLVALDSARDPKFYKGRWIFPKKESGSFIARRPQAYGAPLWGFALLADGKVRTFLDFPPKKDRWRGSDFAWHLQMAIDACRGSPQRYRVRSGSPGPCLDFFSPIPLWAERRLAIVGRPAEREHCLFSYTIPESELPAEEEFLQKRLWLARSDHGRQGD